MENRDPVLDELLSCHMGLVVLVFQKYCHHCMLQK